VAELDEQIVDGSEVERSDDVAYRPGANADALSEIERYISADVRHKISRILRRSHMRAVFGVAQTPFEDAVRESYCDPRYSQVVLEL
jgi:hypothetical protein